MKLYHGSPKKLDVLKPQKAKGINEFENLVAVFLVDSFFHAALYAIGKTLKGKTSFSVFHNELRILGDLEPEAGYVYEVDVSDPIKGHGGQYAFLRELIPIKKTKVYPKDYKKFIVRVKTKEELMKGIKK